MDVFTVILQYLLPKEKIFAGGLCKYIKEIYWRDLDRETKTEMLEYRALNGNLKGIKTLVEYGVDLVACDNYAIGWASNNGHLEVVKYLVSTGKVDSAAENNCAVKWASHNGHLEIVKYLMSTKKVDPTASDNYAIKSASYNGHLEVVKYLIGTKKVDPTASDNWAIRYAYKNGYLEVARYLESLK